MASRVYANCPEHGDFRLPNSDVTIFGFKTADSCRFRCPIGQEIIVKKPDLLDMDLLLAAGCEVILIEPPKIEDGGDMPALTEEDQIRFHNALYRGDDTFS